MATSYYQCSENAFLVTLMLMTCVCTVYNASIHIVHVCVVWSKGHSVHSLLLQALKAAFTEQATVTAAQQDVSEFTHKLLEWVEIAFKTAAAGSNE